MHLRSQWVHSPELSIPGSKALDSSRISPRAISIRRTRKVAVFGTGGIRCEKASSYLLSRGFAEVYHLKGGILSYLERVAKMESRWSGECFVFDERVALGQGLRERSTESDSDD